MICLYMFAFHVCILAFSDQSLLTSDGIIIPKERILQASSFNGTPHHCVSVLFFTVIGGPDTAASQYR